MQANAASALLTFYGTSSNRWCQGALARDQAGRACDPWSQDAQSWCILGACIVLRAQQKITAEEQDNLKTMLGRSLPSFNDTCFDFEAFRIALEQLG